MMHWVVSGVLAALTASAGAWLMHRVANRKVRVPMPDLPRSRLAEDVTAAKESVKDAASSTVEAGSERLSDVLDRIERARKGGDS